MITFPTYYRADLGDGVLCTINTIASAADADPVVASVTEAVWCELMWDYTLKIWGPIANP